MESKAVKDKKEEILSLIERIEKLNAMIDLHHQQDNNDDFMVRQYNFRKEKLLQKFQELLGTLNIKVELKIAA